VCGTHAALLFATLVLTATSFDCRCKACISDAVAQLLLPLNAF
jgi:hypothetical protein